VVAVATVVATVVASRRTVRIVVLELRVKKGRWMLSIAP
jgi:hypothetical protein